jgi:hypothetical protein
VFYTFKLYFKRVLQLSSLCLFFKVYLHIYSLSNLITVVHNPPFLSYSSGLLMVILVQLKHAALPLINICYADFNNAMAMCHLKMNNVYVDSYRTVTFPFLHNLYYNFWAQHCWWEAIFYEGAIPETQNTQLSTWLSNLKSQKFVTIPSPAVTLVAALVYDAQAQIQNISCSGQQHAGREQKLVYLRCFPTMQ